jgi:hypothetical protein
MRLLLLLLLLLLLSVMMLLGATTANAHSFNDTTTRQSVRAPPSRTHSRCR